LARRAKKLHEIISNKNRWSTNLFNPNIHISMKNRDINRLGSVYRAGDINPSGSPCWRYTWSRIYQPFRGNFQEVYIEQEILTLQGHLVGGIYGAGDINISGAPGGRHI
jgi:hypothetical protein